MPVVNLKMPSGIGKFPSGFALEKFSNSLGHLQIPSGQREFICIFFYRVKFTISRGFVYGYPLGDLCTVIPPKAGDFTEIPRFP